MKRFEGKSLEEVYLAATKELGCSMNDLVYKVVTYPKSSIMGMFARNAVIDVDIDSMTSAKSENTLDGQRDKLDISSDKSMDQDNVELERDIIIDNFYDTIQEENLGPVRHKETSDATVLSIITANVIELIESSCFDMDIVEVDLMEGTVYIFIDGDDASLLIGKMGHRYNALYYMLSSWIHSKYQLNTELEIARFVTEQSKMIVAVMEPIVQHIEEKGWAKTKTLDGVLVELALNYLRARFPDKYVAIKKREDGKRYILINKFNQR